MPRSASGSGSECRLLLALPRAQFIAQAVAFAGHGWVRRFEELEKTSEVADQTSRIAKPPEGIDAFSRCNLWILNSARVELRRHGHLYSLLIWDEKPTGDGPGGTSDLASRVGGLGGEVTIINPMKLP